MLGIILSTDKDKKFQFKLNLELGAYCAAYQKLQFQKWAVTEINPESQQTQLTNTSSSEAQIEFSKLRKKMSDELSYFSVGKHWQTIEKNIYEHCSSTKEIAETKLASIFAEGNKPHLLVCMEASFLELIKNSVDAFLKSHLENLLFSTNLEIEIEFVIKANQISMSWRDNAGGFSAEYINAFPEFISSKRYKRNGENKKSEKLEKTDFYFGGKGRGICILTNFLLEGEKPVGSGRSIKWFKTPTESSIMIKNWEKGAQLDLTSPLSPLIPYNSESFFTSSSTSIILNLPCLFNPTKRHTSKKRTNKDEEEVRPNKRQAVGENRESYPLFPVIKVLSTESDDLVEKTASTSGFPF